MPQGFINKQTRRVWKDHLLCHLLKTDTNFVWQSRTEFLTILQTCFVACDIYPYTHTHTHTHAHTGALLWKHLCKYLPPCLLCCYSSHPRIVFPPSLPCVRDSQLAMETAIQSVSHSPFSLYILLFTKGTARLSESSLCLCVCVWASMRPGEFQTDYQWWVTMVMANIRRVDLCVVR